MLLSVLFGGCGTGVSDTADDTDTWENDSESEETDMDYEEDNYEESEETDSDYEDDTYGYEEEASGSTGSDVESQTNSYIVPDSYDIMGKWKSVGESGFGQAQPGAIIIFDGNNCNFYSPNDTYAFYKENDRYVLDITSVLGESLNQTVNIIDDDNIEIAGASLRRIE